MPRSRLIDRGPHTITVYPEEETTDSRGNVVRKPSAVGIVVKGCLVQPLASTRGAFAAVDVRQGQRVDAAYRVFARAAPIGWWSRVEWNGKKLVPLGGPLEYVASDGSRHISCTLKEER